MNGKKLLLVFGLGVVGYSLFASTPDKEGGAVDTDSTGSDDNKINFITKDLKEARSTRNNNPGNVKSVKSSTSSEWQGAKDYDEIGHVIFKNYIWGTRAFIRDVLTKINKRGLNTINKFLPVYCPKSDNCPVATYIAYVEKQSGVNRNTNLQGASNATIFKVLLAMAQYEGGKYASGKYRTKFNQYFFDEAMKIM